MGDVGGVGLARKGGVCVCCGMSAQTPNGKRLSKCSHNNFNNPGPACVTRMSQLQVRCTDGTITLHRHCQDFTRTLLQNIEQIYPYISEALKNDRMHIGKL